MSAPVDVADTISTLAAIVRLHEGNRDAEVNALLERADSCRAAVAELVEAATEHRDSYRDFPEIGSASGSEMQRAADRISQGWRRLDAALARVGGAA